MKVLRRLGVDLDFPQDQTCCGQPAFNMGYRKEATDLAQRFLDIFSSSEYIVVPSGSCGSMAKVFYPDIFRHDPLMEKRAQSVSGRIYEFSQFLVNVLGVTDVGASFHGKVTYHDSCHLLRELGVSTEPRQLIRAVRGTELVELENSDMCCGFGGAFSVKYAQISGAILEDKLRHIIESGADVVVASDSGCLMHMAGAISHRGMPVRTMHLAELLAQEAGP